MVEIISNLGLWSRWIVTTVVGFVLGAIVGTGAAFVAVPLTLVVASSLRLPGANGQGAIGYILLGCAIAGTLVGGAVVGSLQWLVFRNLFAQMRWWWILASAVGWSGIGWTLTVLTYTPVGGPVGQADGSLIETTVWDYIPQITSAIAWLLVAALFMAVVQALALKLGLLQAVWWIAAHLFIFLIAALVMVFWVRGAGGLTGLPVFLVCFAPFYAAVSGKMLIWLLATKAISQN
jgi:hypothetical protein